MLNKLLYLSIALTLALASCKGPEPEAVDFGYDYLPLAIGSELVYRVDSIFYNEFLLNNPVDTAYYLIKEIVIDTQTDLAGNLAYIIERSTFDTNGFEDGAPFRYTLTKVENRVEEQMGNLRKVIMTFPVTEGNSWDGNAFNALEEQQFEYVSIAQSFSLAGQNFDSVATIIQIEDTTNFIFKQYTEEKYARNIGKIYREHLIKETQFGRGDSGIYVIEKIVL